VLENEGWERDESVTEGPSLSLVAPDGTRVGLPLVPETLVRTRTPEGSGERLEFVATLDDRLGEVEITTADTVPPWPP
jgi:hypothetical protein